VKQVQDIREYILQDQRVPGERFWPILMGDFNSQPRTLAHLILLGMFKDANSHENTTLAGTRVYYIFVGRTTGFKINNVGVLNIRTLSDHFPVVARLSFN
jgi:endonuclease/exonuclease/phosphatase family metal-dependent hydrolase